MLGRVVLLCAIMAVAYAAVALAPLEEKPEKFKNVPGCYIKDLDKVIPFGQASPAKIPQCLQYRCDKDFVHIETCGLVAVTPNCKTVEDDTKPYPDCCPKVGKCE